MYLIARPADNTTDPTQLVLALALTPTLLGRIEHVQAALKSLNLTVYGCDIEELSVHLRSLQIVDRFTARTPDGLDIPLLPLPGQDDVFLTRELPASAPSQVMHRGLKIRPETFRLLILDDEGRVVSPPIDMADVDRALDELRAQETNEAEGRAHAQIPDPGGTFVVQVPGLMPRVVRERDSED